MKNLLLNIYLINIFINAIISEKLLKIPFKLYHTSYFFKDKPDIISNKYMSLLVIELSIGTPAQKFNISLDLNDNFYSCFLANNLPNINFSSLYNKSISSTYKCEKEKVYFTIEVFNKAEIFSDNINFLFDGKNIEKSLKFLLIDNLQIIIYTPGFIGLALKNDNRQLEEYSFLYQLKKSGLIKNEIFYFNFENEESGKFIIGEDLFNNENFLKIKVGYISQVSSKLLWSFNFDEIYYGNSINLGIGNGVLGLAYGLTIGPYNYEQIINSVFVKEKDCYLNYTEIGNLVLKYYYCEKNIDIEDRIQNLTFVLKSSNFNFTFTGHDLFFNEDNKKFFKILFLFDSNQQYWYLGHNFLQKYKIRFDHNRKLLYIPLREYEENNNDNKKDDDWNIVNMITKWQFWLCIFLVIIIIGLILFIIIYIKKYPKKKKVYELDDTDDYYIYSKKENLDENIIN